MTQPKIIDPRQLPEPESRRPGWPWDIPEERPPFENGTGPQWPKISIVTPSYNQGRFIEETIRSVLLQGYPNLEYFVIDGGSGDDTIDILRKYGPWLTGWVSEPDRGQSHAINKGFARASGDFLAYINSDDVYEPGIFKKIARTFMSRKNCQLVAGRCTIIEDGRPGRMFEPWWPSDIAHLLQPFGSTFAQPASFWSKTAYQQVGGFDESLHYILDREFFLKLALMGIRPVLRDDVVCRYRVHPGIKTHQTIRFYSESAPVIRTYAQAAGLDRKEERALLKSVTEEMGYLDTFVTWKQRGRIAALLRFAGLVGRSPKLLKQRKFLGLARRLMAFRAADVQELNNTMA
jgi:glycosyltransferase involved in cell wall biosynthesis